MPVVNSLPRTAVELSEHTRPSPFNPPAPMNFNQKLKVFSGRGNIPLAEKIAKALGDELGKLSWTDFPDTEVVVRIEEDVRGRDVFVVQSTCPPVNEHLM